VVDQDIVRISKSLGHELERNPVFLDAVARAQRALRGPLSDGGVHRRRSICTG
jgi:bisphosphoglycerate-independent phosphoglycerate mutase (AlkP superfamily)